jgi:hypothetical protein
MKTILSMLVVLTLAAGASADPEKKSYSTTNVRKPASNALHPPPVTPLGSQVRGAVPRGLAGGNPLQMLNPKAPAKYGTWVDNTSFDQDVPGKWKGIKLFEIVF